MICKIWIGVSLLCVEYSQNLRKPTKSEDSFNASEHAEALIKIQEYSAKKMKGEIEAENIKSKMDFETKLISFVNHWLI